MDTHAISDLDEQFMLFVVPKWRITGQQQVQNYACLKIFIIE
jgi:hypothetical protein